MRRASLGPVLLAILSGLLYPVAFPDYDQGWIAFVALVPLHLALRTLPPGRSFRLGWLSGFVAFAGTMAWVVTAMHVYGKMPLLPAYAVMLLLAAYLGLYVAVYGLLLTWLRRRLPGVGVLAAPFLWVALELLRTYAFSGLPWGLLGYSQYRWLTGIQIADVTGVYGVSFYLVLVNVVLAELLAWAWPAAAGLAPSPAGQGRPEATPSASLWWATGTTGVLLLSVVGYGAARLASLDPSAGTIAVAVVQPNIDQARKWDEAFRRETMDRYTRLTRQVEPAVDLVVWPEAATPFLFEQEQAYRLEVAALVRAQRAPLLFGSPALRYYPNGRPYLLNSAYLFSDAGDIVGRYDKQHLVPFGEYIPLRRLLFFLDKLVEGIGDFEAGTVPTVLALPDRETPLPSRPRFGVVICFEVIFPNLVREFVRDGAQFMVTITNDAWFGRSAAPYQHFGMVVFRAVENHVAFARAANTGVSGFIDRRGRILEATPIFTEATAQAELSLTDSPTFYSRHGDVFAYTCVIMCGIFIGAALTRRRPAMSPRR